MNTLPIAQGSPPALRRRLVLGLTSAVLVALGVWAAFGITALLSARTEALAGLGRLEAISDAIDLSALTRSDSRAAMVASLGEAERHFDAAQAHIDSAWLAPLRILPVAGTQLRSVDALATSASVVTGTLAGLLEDIGPLVSEDARSIKELISFLPEAHELLANAAQRLEGLDLGPSTGLMGTLADARGRFEREISEPATLIRSGATIVGGLNSFFNEPNRYVVAVANNAEMRAGSGMWLMMGSLESSGTGITFGDFDHSSQLLVPPGEAQILDSDYKALWGWMLPEIDWRNLAASPRFPASAVTAADMWFGLMGERADGVLVVDVLAMKALLRVIGPITVGEDELTVDNVVGFLTYEQYAISNRFRRRELLSELLEATFTALFVREFDLLDLARALSDAGAGRHILIWSSHEEQQAAWQVLGVDGTLEEDSLAVSVVNRGVNKLDPFVTIHAQVDVREASDQRTVTIVTSLSNDAPSDAYSYVLGTGRAAEPSTLYEGILTFNVPGYATGLVTDDQANVIVEGPDGPTQVVGLWVEFRSGETVEHTLTFTVPKDRPLLVVEPSARLPATDWTIGAASFTDAKGRVIDLSDLVSS